MLMSFVFVFSAWHKKYSLRFGRVLYIFEVKIECCVMQGSTIVPELYVWEEIGQEQLERQRTYDCLICAANIKTSNKLFILSGCVYASYIDL